MMTSRSPLEMADKASASNTSAVSTLMRPQARIRSAGPQDSTMSAIMAWVPLLWMSQARETGLVSVPGN